MHVVIDLGETHSYLACWERGNTLDDACINIKLPGVALFQPTAGENSWQRENLRAYFAYLYHEYLLPSRIIIESAALAIPEIFDLKSRRILLDILEEIFGLYEAAVIPHSLALLAGVQMRTPHLQLYGDVMVIEEQEASSYKFAFISVIETIGITLEKQFSGSISEFLAVAEQNGYHSSKGWRFDHLLLAGSHAPNPTIEEFIASLPPNLNVINALDLDFAATEGLAINSNEENTTPLLPFNIIYPFEFYLEKNNLANLERIPFDTANLELSCGGRYRMTSLDQTSIYNLAADQNRVHFRIYELMAADGPHFCKPLTGALPVLEIDIPKNDMPPHIELSLDMSTATVQLDFITESLDDTTPIPIVFEQLLRANQQKLYETLRRNEQNEALLKDWNKYLYSHRENSPTLSDQIDQTLFHLYGLLQLWQGK